MRGLAIAVFLVLSGCSAVPAPATTTDAPHCDEATGATMVEEFASIPTWNVESGNWSVASPGMLNGVGVGGFSSFVTPERTYDDLEMSVSFRIIDPASDAAGAGLVVHYHNESNYQIIRYSVRESGWHLFTWETDAGRQKQNEALTTLNPLHAAGDWVNLRVISTDGLLTAYDCGSIVLEYQIPAGHSRAGGVGPFLRENTTADFKAFRLDAD